MIASTVTTVILLWAVTLTGASKDTTDTWFEFHRDLCRAEPMSVKWQAERGRLSSTFICFQAEPLK